MKKTLLALLLTFVISQTYTQQWVSTSPQKKKAVLEFFTGHQALWEPAGHKISDSLELVYPGNFYTIMIHAGGYATMKAPNYTTSVGTSKGNG